MNGGVGARLQWRIRDADNAARYGSIDAWLIGG
jgi:hypothetical protein